MSITILSGPVGAGKTTIARELVPMLSAPVSHIEGDTFWRFVANAHSQDAREVFHVVMRAMMAAAIPFRAPAITF
jgi:adenylate kinase family enzyme